MKPFVKFTSLCLLLLPGTNAIAAIMPQDNWGYYGKKLAEPDALPKKCVAANGSAVFVGVKQGISASSVTNIIQKYASDGSYQGVFLSGLSNVTGIVCEADGDVIVMDHGAMTLKAYNPAGTLLWEAGGANAPGDGSTPGKFGAVALSARNYSSTISIDSNGEIYAADPGNSRVMVFSSTGTFSRLIGGAGTAGGQFQSLAAVAVKDGTLYTVDSPTTSGRHRIQQFKADGTFLKSYGDPELIGFIVDTGGRFAIAPDGLLATSAVTGQNAVFDSSLSYLGELVFAHSPINTIKGASFTAAGDLWQAGGNSAYFFERSHSSTDNAPVRNVVPQPKVIKVAQRPASTLLDIDYQVIDPDSATVETAALAFVNGGDSLANVLRLTTLVEGTAANVGAGQASNTTKRLTWNAATDWTTPYGDIQVEVLAKDERDLLGVHWITVPSSGGNPAFKASARTVEDSDLLSIWYWLIAKGDPAVSLVSGAVKGVGGAYNGQTLASGTTTTAAGRNFLYARLGVRVATAGELSSIAAGSYGFASTGATTLVKP